MGLRAAMVAAVWLAPAVAWATSWWWCQSIAASFVDFGDPGYGATLSSNNCPVLSACDDLDGDTTIIDERTSCFVRETSYWWSELSGFEDHHARLRRRRARRLRAPAAPRAGLASPAVRLKPTLAYTGPPEPQMTANSETLSPSRLGLSLVVPPA